jgi:hypothetical protein
MLLWIAIVMLGVEEQAFGERKRRSGAYSLSAFPVPKGDSS